MQVYLLTNLINGKYYVGKTVNPNLRQYLTNNKFWAATSDKGKKYWHRMPIIAALRKYGIENFTAEVLTRATNDDELNMFERLWITALDSRNPAIGYNLSAGGEGMRFPKSEDAKRKIGLANKGRKPKGYKRTELHLQQRRDAMKGNNIGIKITPETAKKWKAAETVEQKTARYAAIKASWAAYTPEERAARVAKMQNGRHLR